MRAIFIIINILRLCGLCEREFLQSVMRGRMTRSFNIPIDLKKIFRLLIALVSIGGFTQEIQKQAPILQTGNILAPDSLIMVINGDTLSYQRHYFIEYPPYLPGGDSLVAAKKAAASQSQTETGLAATGSVSRGIQVSSNASVSLQSSMYLKINGKLSEDYTVSGVLTEKTSPLQPIGNTRRLNDFDRVLVSVSGPALNAAVGDMKA